LYSFYFKKKYSIENAEPLLLDPHGNFRNLTTRGFVFKLQNYTFSGHIVAVMALMEIPAIIVGLSS
jgi:hypothetical protein